MSKHGNGGAALASEPRQGESELQACRREVAELRKLFATMAALVLPANLRNHCGCGRLACRRLTVTRPGAPNAEQLDLCSECKLPSGASIVGTLELGPNERDLVRLANELGCLRPSQPSTSPS